MVYFTKEINESLAKAVIEIHWIFVEFIEIHWNL